MDFNAPSTKRSDAWRAQYRNHRYLSHLSSDDLVQRIADIMSNFMTLVSGPKLSLVPLDSGGNQLVQVFTHCLEEMNLRSCGFPSNLLQHVHLPDPKSPLAPNAIKAVAAFSSPRNGCFFKYGKLNHLLDILSHGRIRISPASSFEDPSLNPAIKDEELELSIQPYPLDLKLTIRFPKSGEIITGPEKIRHYKITEKSVTDYYVWCMSRRLTPRLFLDFNNAEACLVIIKPEVFFARLHAQFKKVVGQWVWKRGPVQYVDPVITKPGDFEVFFAKYFRYAYQAEFRVVWLPKNPIKKLDIVFLTLGPLADCCQLISLYDYK